MKSLRLIEHLSGRHLSRQRESGAVSLFVVIFAMLLITVVTVSFLRIMVDDQNRATGNDLSQSALDSAYAGVEDAKRALVWYLECEINPASDVKCDRAADIVTSTTCNYAIRESGVVRVGVDDSEIKVQQAVSADGTSQDAALDQAYTCVKINLDTDDYLSVVPANQSILVPLSGVSEFNRVQLEWFSRDDMTTTDGVINVPSSNVEKGLLRQASWPASRPSVMRVQFMQTGDAFSLNQFDYVDYTQGGADRQSNTNTVFLYPARVGWAGSMTGMAGDLRASQPDGSATGAIESFAPRAVTCTDVAAGGYSCKAFLNLPKPMDGGNYSNRYLRLTALYVGSHIKVSLLNNPGDPLAAGGTLVKFKGVQPAVDSTGRTSNVFRRVESRIDLYDGSSFPYPDAAVDVTKSFCKDFGVTPDAYIAGSCQP